MLSSAQPSQSELARLELNAYRQAWGDKVTRLANRLLPEATWCVLEVARAGYF